MADSGSMLWDHVRLRAIATQRALQRAGDAIPRVSELDSALGDRLVVRLQLLVRDIQDRLSDESSAAATAELISQGNSLIGETLAFVSGAAARHLNLDDGITSLALAWLDQLSHAADLEKVGLVIPASTEFTGMLTQVIRLRLPVDGIWGLPVAVHEYGHFVASKLARREERRGITRTVIPIEELAYNAGTETDFPRLYWHGHELFADALAAATTGPAYVRYCIHHRFEPGAAQEISATHPEPTRRIRVQLRALQRLASGEQAPYIADEVRKLADLWQTMVTEAGRDPEVRPEPLLDGLEEQLLGCLDDYRLVRIRYTDHIRARVLAESPLDQADEPVTVPTALNAGWVRRLKNDGVEARDEVAADCERLIREALERD